MRGTAALQPRNGLRSSAGGHALKETQLREWTSIAVFGGRRSGGSVWSWEYLKIPERRTDGFESCFERSGSVLKDEEGSLNQ